MTLENLWNASYNSGFGFYASKPKIFVIGFNKCGTTSIHKFFHSQGLRSVHWKLGDRPLAVGAFESNDRLSCQKLFSTGQVFSDFTYLTDSEFYEPLDLFPFWREIFPNAYFIFNDRSVESWLNSRASHRRGTFLRRYMSLYSKSEEEVRSDWRAKFLAHRNDVTTYFKGDERFCHFVLEQDSGQKIVSFLEADYRLNEKYFGQKNVGLLR